MKKKKSHHVVLDTSAKKAHYKKAAVYMAAFGAVGAALVIVSRAATIMPAVKATDAVLSGNAVVVDNAGAYGGKAIRFQAAPPPPPPTYDLVVTDVGISGSAVAGIRQQLWADIRNNGNAVVPAGFGVALSAEGKQQSWGFVTQNVSPGQTIRVLGTGVPTGDPTFYWHASPGTTTIAATVDDTNLRPSESNESNNTLQKSLTFVAEAVSVNTPIPLNLNAVWCGPPWDAPQEEYSLAAQRGLGLLGPPCKAEGGFIEQTVEQNHVAMDKAAAAGTRILVFGGYTCGNAYDHACYKMYVNPEAVIDMYPTRSGMGGFFVVDEPPFEEFDQIGAVNQRVIARRPGLIAYTNIFGNVTNSAPNTGFGCAPNKCPITFDDYVWNYIYKTRPQILSYDDYNEVTSVRNNSTNPIKVQQGVLRDFYGIPVAPLMTAVPSVTNGFLPRDFGTMWNRYTTLKSLAEQNGTTLHFTWRRPPGTEWYGDGECGIARVQLGYSGVPICGY